MASIINASTSAGLVQSADTSGTLQLQSGGTTKQTIDSTGSYGQLVSGTAQASTSGTSIDFTSIPSWVKRVTVMFNGVSTNGTTSLQIQLGYSGGVETTGYVSVCGAYGSVTPVSSTTGMCVTSGSVAANSYSGQAIICLLGSNFWTLNSNMVRNDAANGFNGAAYKTTTGALDRIRITTFGGTDTFDAGSINILYEG